MDGRCGQCSRVTDTHADGCSHPACPHRAPQMWRASEGAQGFPGLMAEDRIILTRRQDAVAAVEIDVADL